LLQRVIGAAYFVAHRVATTGATKIDVSQMAKRSTARASPEIEKLKAANLAYYKALSARDISAMAQVWTCAGDNILIAPPENAREHVGWTAIRRNWERYWPTFDQFSVSMKVNKINVSGPVAWVHGIEKTRWRKKTGEVSSSRNFGTNIFINRNGHWQMVFHQAAAIPRKS
jgi:ketosteroid isomerase-like protein